MAIEINMNEEEKNFLKSNAGKVMDLNKNVSNLLQLNIDCKAFEKAWQERVENMIEHLNSLPVEKQMVFYNKEIKGIVNELCILKITEFRDDNEVPEQELRKVNWLKELKECYEAKLNILTTETKLEPTLQEENEHYVGAFALMHVYWAIFDKTKKITTRNQERYRIRYKIRSKNTLLQTFQKLSEEDLPLKPAETKNSVRWTLNRYKSVLLLLEKENLQAYNLALEHFNKLKNQYNYLN